MLHECRQHRSLGPCQRQSQSCLQDRPVSIRGNPAERSAVQCSGMNVPLSVMTGPALATPMRSVGLPPIFVIALATVTCPSGMTSRGTPLSQFVPSTLLSLRWSATITNLSAAAATSFSCVWHAPPPAHVGARGHFDPLRIWLQHTPLIAFKASSTSSAPSIAISM